MILFVSNISFHASDQDLRELFLEAGYRVDSLSMPINSDTGNPRGFAFVEIEDEELALSAIADMDGQDLMGRKLNVQKARERDSRPRRDSARSAAR